METVADILNSKGHDIWTVSPITSVGEAVSIMAKKNIGAVLVVGGDGQPVGILSERDVARGLLTLGEGLKESAVDALMSKDVRCIKADHSVDDAMAVMTHNRIRHLPVCDNDKLVGIVTIGDVVKAEIHEKNFVIEQLEHYITGSL